MIRYLFPLILLAVSIGIFAVFINPFYKQEIQPTRVQIAQLDEALSNAKRIQAERDALLEKFRTISDEDLERIKRLLPDNVDSVRLILEIDRIASQYGVIIKDIRVSDISDAAGDGLGPREEKLYGAIGLSLTFIGSYDPFRNLVFDLERSLRIVDITTLSFTAIEQDLNQYSVGIQTYWLK